MGRIIFRLFFLSVLFVCISFTEIKTMDIYDKEYIRYFNEMILPSTLAGSKSNEEFLTLNSSRKEVISDKSGLQYICIKEGTGEKPRHWDESFIIHYNGFLKDGTLFDASKIQVGPVQFAFDEFVKCLSTGVKKMARGISYIFYLAPKSWHCTTGL